MVNEKSPRVDATPGQQRPAGESSDAALLELLRRGGRLGVAALVKAMQVTPTAVRQRLNRLMVEGLVERTTMRRGRGRPSHYYQLSEKGVRAAGDNFADLAAVLWEELRAVRQPEIRRGMLQRIARRLAEKYRGAAARRGDGAPPVAAFAELLADREISCEASEADGLPVLTMYSCPYPELAEQDRGICAMEKLLVSELAGSSMELSECRLDGADCCTFQATG